MHTMHTAVPSFSQFIQALAVIGVRFVFSHEQKTLTVTVGSGVLWYTATFTQKDHKGIEEFGELINRPFKHVTIQEFYEKLPAPIALGYDPEEKSIHLDVSGCFARRRKVKNDMAAFVVYAGLVSLVPAQESQALGTYYVIAERRDDGSTNYAPLGNRDLAVKYSTPSEAQHALEALQAELRYPKGKVRKVTRTLRTTDDQ